MALKAYSLITVDEAKTYLGIATGDHDTFIVDILNGIADAFENYVGTHLKTHGAAITEVFDGMGRGHHKLFPDAGPIGAVTSIHVDQARVFGAGALVDAGDYVIHAPERTWIELLPAASISVGTIGLQGFFAWGVQNIQLIYTAGFGATGAPAVPDDLKQAARLTVSRWIKDSDHATLGKGTARIQSHSVGDQSWSFTPPDILPVQARALLDRYKGPTVL